MNFQDLNFVPKPAYGVKLSGSLPFAPTGLAVIDCTFRLETGVAGVEVTPRNF